MNPQLLQLICFYGFGAITVIAALAVITLKNTVHSVLSLVLTFFSTACLWMLADAEFLALALIVVYVGAVMVLFLFVVMMLDIDQEKIREGFVKFLPVGLIVAVAMLVEMLGLIGVKAMHAQVMGPDPAAMAGVSNTAWLGQALYTRYLLPFEVAALILTVGLPRCRVDRDCQGRTHRFAQLAGNAAFFAVGVATQRVQATETIGLRNVLHRIAHGVLRLEHVANGQCHSLKQLDEQQTFEIVGNAGHGFLQTPVPMVTQPKYFMQPATRTQAMAMGMNTFQPSRMIWS